MSRTVVRRLTAAIALLAVLGLALPAAAAADRPHAKAPAVTSSLLDQFLGWLGVLWPAQPSNAQARTSPAKAAVTPPLPLDSLERGGMIDPNGGG
ncbi:MAG TPA: hypothetical protein VGH73_07030 [Thermoanaerobaculia bacterium]|jgi:hypothetical protein